MPFYKQNLWVYIVVFINLSSSYLVKVLAKSKKQDVDTFIQKLLDSEKFDKLADKIAMKAVQRINIYNNKMAQEQLRSGIAMDDTHRSAPIKKKTEDAIGTAKLFSTQALTSEEKKTTIISLKYKRFTRNILDEATGNSKTATNKGEVYEEQLTNKEDTSSIKRTTKKVSNNEKLETKEETSNMNKIKPKNNSIDGDHNGELTPNKNTTSAKKLITANNSILATEKETTNDDDDTVEEFGTRKETIGNKKTTKRFDDKNEDNYLNKFYVDENKQVPRIKNDYDDGDNDKDAFEKNVNAEDTADNKNTRDKNTNYEDDSDDEVVLSEKPRKPQHKDRKGEKSFSPDDAVRKHERIKNNNKKRRESEDTKINEDRANFGENSSRYKHKQDVYKDTGDADPEDEKDNSDSTEERLSNNKILVRREGNTLYAQDLDEYADYRAQLAHSRKRSF